MNYLKNNIISIIVLLWIITLTGLLIYFNYYKTTTTISKSNNIINIDSIKSVIHKEYRHDLDSINTNFNNRVNQLQQKDKQLENKIKNLTITTGELPDFK